MCLHVDESGGDHNVRQRAWMSSVIDNISDPTFISILKSIVSNLPNQAHHLTEKESSRRLMPKMNHKRPFAHFTRHLRFDLDEEVHHRDDDVETNVQQRSLVR